MDKEVLTIGGWGPGGATFFRKHDVFNYWDFVAYKIEIDNWGKQKYRRAYFQFGAHNERSAKLAELTAWVKIHALPGEEFYLHLWRKSHWEGRGENKKYIKGVTWESEEITR